MTFHHSGLEPSIMRNTSTSDRLHQQRANPIFQSRNKVKAYQSLVFEIGNPDCFLRGNVLHQSDTGKLICKYEIEDKLLIC